MASGIIADAQITASDYDDQNGAAPATARLNANGYWATKEEFPTYPWIQVDFFETVVITGIQTQGSSDSNRNDWVTELRIRTGDNVNTLNYIMEGTCLKV